MSRHYCRLFVAIAAAVVGLSCAGQIPPPGGPPDTTPPSIIATGPSPGTLGFRGEEFHLAFSEYVDRRSVEEAVFLSPPLGRLTFDWSGTQVAIHFRDSLRPNTTYIMTVGTDVRDIRERGNRMSSAFALPFSTGDHLDSAVISGRVVDAKPDGVMIFAYALDARTADTVNPGTLRPDFVSQTGKDGTFRLPYLPLGSYRLVAVVDEYKNLLYDRQIDRYGVATGDVRLTAAAPSVTGIQFRLTAEDTTAPFLSSVRAVDRTGMLVRFSEAMDTAGLNVSAFALVDTLSGALLPLVAASLVDTARRDVQIVTGPQDSARSYRLTVSGVRDRAGNRISGLASSAVVEGSARPDTTPPVMTFPFSEDTTKGVPADLPIAFSWKEPVRTASARGGLQLADSADHPVPSALRWDGSMNALLIPDVPLALGGRYVLRVNLDSMIDAAGNHRADSVRVFHFQMGDERQYSSIAGVVKADSSGSTAPVHVIAALAGGGHDKRYETIAESGGGFSFGKVAEGLYAFELYRDRDGDNAYSFGKVFPFQPSETFGTHADTVKVRARWPLEGVVLRIAPEPQAR